MFEVPFATVALLRESFAPSVDQMAKGCGRVGFEADRMALKSIAPTFSPYPAAGKIAKFEVIRKNLLTKHRKPIASPYRPVAQPG
jgi:hypothetical protein